SIRMISTIQLAHPLWEFRDYPKFNLVPGGWLTRSHTYYDFLNRFNISSGDQLAISNIHNNSYFTYWDHDQSFEKDMELFMSHINRHYSTSAENELRINIISDNRTRYVGGMVIFKLVTNSYP